jgi:predicted N-acetyltransferase YhbS
MAEAPDKERDSMLRETALHRGFRLVKSRRRKPGGDYGLYGLTDARTGQDCFGIGKDGLEATADEIEEYLRGAAKADWKRSLKSAGQAARSSPANRPVRGERSTTRPPPDPKPEPELKPEPSSPERVVRDAKAGDAESIAALILAAGSDSSERDITATLRQLVHAGAAPLVADEGGIVGCVAWHVLPALQHSEPVGRLTLLLVAPDERRRGIGRELAEAAEARLKQRGCGTIEAVSDIELTNAHGFFRKLGYGRTSYRFLKPA